MPHTSRTNRTKYSGKLKIVPVPGNGETGWSEVVRSNATKSRRGGEGHRADPGPPRNVTGATVGELRRGYERRRKEWEGTEGRRKVKGWVRVCLDGVVGGESLGSDGEGRCRADGDGGREGGVDSEVKGLGRGEVLEGEMKDEGGEVAGQGKRTMQFEEEQDESKRGDVQGRRARRINQAICLALGSFTARTDDRSLWQLAVFMVMVDDIKEHSGSTITLEVKDPAFSNTDIKFLETLGFKVLSLEDELVMDQHTFLFVPFLDARFEAAILVHAERCPVYVTSGLKGTGSYLEALERSSKGNEEEVSSSDLSREEIRANLEAAKRIQQSHSSLEFPEVPNSGHAFTGLRIHLLQHED